MTPSPQDDTELLSAAGRRRKMSDAQAYDMARRASETLVTMAPTPRPGAVTETPPSGSGRFKRRVHFGSLTSKVVSRISRGSASTTSEASEGSGTSGSYYTKPKIFRRKNK